MLAKASQAPTSQEDTAIKELQINNQIRDKEIRLIGSNGQQLGLLSASAAQRIADEEGLDLVKIAPTSVPPVCKIMDYSKYKYEQNIARKFLKDGNKVKATIRMRGRQQAYASQGVEVMKKFAEILSDVSKIDKQPLTEGRNISMFLAPLK